MTGPRGDEAPEAVGGLGPPIRAPEPEKPEWVPTETKWIERNTKTGKLRTNIPANDIASAPFIFIPVGEVSEP